MRTAKQLQRVLGIDPGYGRVGYAVIEGDGQHWNVVTYGCITTPSDEPLANRLLIISNDLTHIIHQYQPTHASVEELFFAKNTKTAIQVAHARGVLLFLLSKENIPFVECTPLQVKQALVGYGRAEKRQVQHMVAQFFRLRTGVLQDDAADALAIALTGAMMIRV